MTFRLKLNKSKNFHSYLMQTLFYNPKTGKFIYIKKPNFRIKIGSEAGCRCIDEDGYVRIRIKIKKVSYSASILAWFYMTGKWPKNQIDHKDLNSENNEWNNLREATVSENQHNKVKPIRNKSGFKGVCYHKASNKFMAQININGKKIYLGVYNTAKEAFLIYKKAGKEYSPEFFKV